MTSTLHANAMLDKYLIAVSYLSNTTPWNHILALHKALLPSSSTYIQYSHMLSTPLSLWPLPRALLPFLQSHTLHRAAPPPCSPLQSTVLYQVSSYSSHVAENDPLASPLPAAAPHPPRHEITQRRPSPTGTPISSALFVPHSTSNLPAPFP